MMYLAAGRVRHVLPPEVRLDHALAFGRRLPDARIPQRNRVAAHRPHQVRIGPGDDAVNVLVVALAVKQELMRELHHPVGAALDVGHDEHVVFGRLIALERILGAQFLALPVAHRREQLAVQLEALQDPEHGPHRRTTWRRKTPASRAVAACACREPSQPESRSASLAAGEIIERGRTATKGSFAPPRSSSTAGPARPSSSAGPATARPSPA